MISMVTLQRNWKDFYLLKRINFLFLLESANSKKSNFLFEFIKPRSRIAQCLCQKVLNLPFGIKVNYNFSNTGFQALFVTSQR